MARRRRVHANGPTPEKSTRLSQSANAPTRSCCKRIARFSDRDSSAIVLRIHSLGAPVEWIDPSFTAITSLHITHAGIDRVPLCISTITQLRTLDLHGNSISTFPAQLCMSLQQLRVLDLSQNRLLSLPTNVDQIRELRTLLLSSNQLQSLPHQITRLEHLYTLQVDDNAFPNQTAVHAPPHAQHHTHHHHECEHVPTLANLACRVWQGSIFTMSRNDQHQPQQHNGDFPQQCDLSSGSSTSATDWATQTYARFLPSLVQDVRPGDDSRACTTNTTIKSTTPPSRSLPSLLSELSLSDDKKKIKHTTATATARTVQTYGRLSSPLQQAQPGDQSAPDTTNTTTEITVPSPRSLYLPSDSLIGENKKPDLDTTAAQLHSMLSLLKETLPSDEMIEAAVAYTDCAECGRRTFPACECVVSTEAIFNTRVPLHSTFCSRNCALRAGEREALERAEQEARVRRRMEKFNRAPRVSGIVRTTTSAATATN